MEREVIKLQTDVPVVVLLDYGPEGKEVKGQFGVQYQFTLNNDSAVMWIDPQARDALRRSGAQAGDEVEILKQQKGKAVSYGVRLVSDAQPSAPAARPAPRGAKASGLPARAYYPAVPGNGAAPAPAQAIEQQARTAEYVTRELKSARVGEPARPAPEASAPQQPRQPEVHPITEQLAKCLRSAVDACKQAQDYAREQQLGIQFTSEDVRAIGLSVYIGQQRNGSAR